jgi:uncharacterized repeat protein (TIGR03847 family)
MELGPVTRITADAVGEPGMRAFFLQADASGETITIAVEKEQVQLLAASILELLADLELTTGQGPDEDEMGLHDPVEPRWRAGKLSLGYDRDLELFQLEIEELQPEVAEDDPAFLLVGEPESITLLATREQMFALSRHGAAVSERGRPACQYCGNPMDPEGHACPAMNGHSSRD